MVDVIIFIVFCIEIPVSKECWPFQTPQSVASELGLHCLHNTLNWVSGPGCSKLTTLLVNVSLKFQTLISRICQYFLLKKCEKLLQCKSFSHFSNKKYQCFRL